MFDKIISLPKIASSVQSEVTAKLNEGVAKVSSLASTGISKIASGVPSFQQLASSNILGKAVSPVLGDLSAQLGGAASQLAAGLGSQIPNAFGLLQGFSTLNGVTASGLRATIGEPADPAADDSHKVKLVSQLDGSAVIFDNMPEIQETRAADYEPLQPPQLPGEFQKYKGTKSVQWTITAVLTASTTAEATLNRYYVNTLRVWTFPFFGEQQQQKFNRLGAPPPVVNFMGWRNLVVSVPTVITNLNWTWPKDVDWLPTSEIDSVSGMPIPFPAVITITITLVESFSPAQMNSIDLASYRAGDLIGAYSSSSGVGNSISNTGELNSALGNDIFNTVTNEINNLPSAETLLADNFPSAMSNVMDVGPSAIPNMGSSGLNINASGLGLTSSINGITSGTLNGLSINNSSITLPNTSANSSLPSISNINYSISSTSTPTLSSTNILANTSNSISPNSQPALTSSFGISNITDSLNNLASTASFKLNQLTYSGVPSDQLTYTGSDPIVWDRVNSERLRRGLAGLPNTRP